jgi:hypothetical protein
MMKRYQLDPDRVLPLANRRVEFQTEQGVVSYQFRALECGELVLPSGRLVPCDPFVTLGLQQNVEIQLPSGRYAVWVTIADVSEEQDASHEREAYLSLILSNQPSVSWAFLSPLRADQVEQALDEGEFIGIPVDAGTVGMVDAEAVERLMPQDSAVWYDTLFDHPGVDSWFAQMDNPQQIRAGCVNILLPGATQGENLILSHSGWGDGCYALIATFDAVGGMTGVHIDLAVVPVAPLAEWD